MKRWAIAFAVLPVLVAGGCDEDPVHSDAVAALGGEVPGVREGPLHRAGQPCLVCHGGSGPGSPEWSVGGTVFQLRDSRVALADCVVSMTDANGSVFEAKTNEVGNFYVEASRWTPRYPMRVTLVYRGVRVEMKTRIGRDGSCAGCHRDPEGNDSAGHIFFAEDPTKFPGALP